MAKTKNTPTRLITEDLQYNRKAIMQKAWEAFRRMQRAGLEASNPFALCLLSAWQTAKAQMSSEKQKISAEARKQAIADSIKNKFAHTEKRPAFASVSYSEAAIEAFYGTKGIRRD